MLSKRPSFQLFPIDLSVAGSQIINELTGMVQFVRAEYQSGAGLALLAKVNVQLGDVASDPLPASVNTTIVLDDPQPCVILSWAAQPGVTAFFAFARDKKMMIHSPPAMQLVVQSSGSALGISKTAVGISAGQIDAGGTIQTRTIRNTSTSSQIIYLGNDATVTAATGYPINPGEAITLSSTSAPVFAIASAAGGEVRILTEK